MEPRGEADACSHYESFGSRPDSERSGRKLGIWSLVMLPMHAISFGVAVGVAFGLTFLFGLDREIPNAEQGVRGFVTEAAIPLVFFIPAMIGVILGWKAWRRVGRLLFHGTWDRPRSWRASGRAMAAGRNAVRYADLRRDRRADLSCDGTRSVPTFDPSRSDS